MTTQEINDLLHKLPDTIEDQDQFIDELDNEEIPWDRLPKLKELMRGDNEFLSIEAARLLANWGDDEGFSFLESFVCDRAPPTMNWMPHRLHGYDDNYKHILDAITMYEARKCDADPLNKLTYRKRISKSVKKIIELSNLMSFQISGLFPRVGRDGYIEYIPDLKTHFEAILKNPKLHHWKVGDCAHLLMKFDPEFVTQALAKHGKTLADYPNK
jgi:hypothetical protein